MRRLAAIDLVTEKMLWNREYELGCDVGERRSREFWQRRFGVTPD